MNISILLIWYTHLVLHTLSQSHPFLPSLSPLVYSLPFIVPLIHILPTLSHPLTLHSNFLIPFRTSLSCPLPLLPINSSTLSIHDMSPLLLHFLSLSYISSIRHYDPYISTSIPLSFPPPISIFLSLLPPSFPYSHLPPINPSLISPSFLFLIIVYYVFDFMI